MKKLVLIGLFLLALVFAGCDDEGNAEIIVNSTLNGRTQNCTILVYNNKDVQINQVSTERGIGYVNDLPAGTYTLKFKDYQDTFFSAVKVVTVVDGDSKPVKVELSDPPDAAAGGSE